MRRILFRRDDDQCEAIVIVTLMVRIVVGDEVV